MKSFRLLVLCLAFSVMNLDAEPTLAEFHERGGLPNLFDKLNRGGEVKVAYLGGSITARDGWRPKTLNWFKSQHPKSVVKEIYAAIGGTGSDLGVFRLDHDVLRHKPDLLFVEFAVNDGSASVEQIHRCMEGIVRQTWRRDPATDICFVYTLAGNMLEELQSGRLPRSMAAMETLAEHYAIPSINMGLEVARLEKTGGLVFKGEKPKTEAEKQALGSKILFSPDGVHPYTDTGHQLYYEAVVRGMVRIQSEAHAAPHDLKSPLRADNWEAAKIVPLSKTTRSGSWRKLDAATNGVAKSFGGSLPELWVAGAAQDSLWFRFRGTVARIYDLMGPDCGQLNVNVDDQPTRVQLRFDSFSTYHRLSCFSVSDGLPDGIHSVRVTINTEVPDKAKILSQRQEKMDDPKRFEGINWYAGALLLVGDLVE